MRKAEDICMSGETYSAREMQAMGVVDIVVPDGDGTTAVRDFIARRSKHAKAQRALATVRSLVNPISKAELDAIVEAWIACAMNLDAKDLRMMGRLIRAQVKLSAAAQDTDEEAAVDQRFAVAVNG
jgi:DSF synthase